MGFNSAFKGLKYTLDLMKHVTNTEKVWYDEGMKTVQ